MYLKKSNHVLLIKMFRYLQHLGYEVTCVLNFTEFSMLKSDDDCNIHALPLDSKNNPQRTHKKMDIVAINFNTLLAYPLPHTCLIELEL